MLKKMYLNKALAHAKAQSAQRNPNIFNDKEPDQSGELFALDTCRILLCDLAWKRLLLVVPLRETDYYRIKNEHRF